MSVPSPADTTSRPVGGTEYSWCKAVPGGTGVSILAFLFSKQPDISHLQSCIHKLQNSHPILRSKLRFDPATSGYSFVTPVDSSPPQIQPSDHTQSFELTIEHEMNTNPWANTNKQVNETNVMFVNVYNLPEQQWAVVLRLHTAACDRAAAAFLFRELLGLLGGGGDKEIVKEDGVGLAIEDCVPAGKASKPFWARGADMIGYSVNSFRFSNLEFKENGVPNSTQLVRMKIGVEDTEKILSACKAKDIKLFVLLAAAGIIAARASKNLSNDKTEKYSLTTLMDCRSLLEPVLSDHHIGFYHSALLNNHDVKGGEDLWELAQKIYASLTTAKDSNKHFTDMADLNLLMCKVVDNPGLTPSSSLRTSLISLFDETLVENTNQCHKDIGLLDYVGCASVHGASPSLAIFDTIRDGELDCACVYPSPTHSREQMQAFVDHMKQILIASSVPK
ncbi:putative chloramphenicol acetyltransferase-like domain superfamily [Helianthus annuus]|nr:putative chloramphenicol acetyltransferase-like domain superfamily [Helianthus annuus]KAJ0626386.1 putative chloramphenicol acetyltransferase-like domain superfamily [Helianthus annuus]KAJ0782729.1 putative chloramphenicol acetyltransferase-like domain superfamily [Helianthus annuus]KAJ0956339.1 putative chloramphenicol acetyltransferase-like domain superfamily [Helianthus annuus]